MRTLVWLLWALIQSTWTLFCAGLLALLRWPGWAAGRDWDKELPEWRTPGWLPDWLVELLGLDDLGLLRELLVEWGPGIQRALAGLGEFAGWLEPVLWTVWGGTSLVLLLATWGLSRLFRPALAPQDFRGLTG